MGDIVRRKWMTMMDVHAGEVERVYGGPVGLIWEMLAGEETDTERDLDALAERAGLDGETRVLALLPGPGDPARRIAREYGATVIGLVAIPQMVDEAVRRTEEAGLTARIDIQQGNALHMPFHEGIFDVVWGQDTWCYVTDKDQMVREVFRVVKPGGTLAFTDWVQTGPMSDDEWHTLIPSGLSRTSRPSGAMRNSLSGTGLRLRIGGRSPETPPGRSERSGRGSCTARRRRSPGSSARKCMRMLCGARCSKRTSREKTAGLGLLTSGRRLPANGWSAADGCSQGNRRAGRRGYGVAHDPRQG
ncbi:2-methoxy-6-polyprenyl-1,4-benzoquinol methylase, mitochondrial [subsurface metagenome]